ncbi:hypothetical protein SDC9_51660 [bioreactor metagenome]|uniref:Uncharacterized protein n=1 Tax=bioreactor metagenome TaxID=1076179 RepID=A0A644WNH3_9ZZZZ
MLARQPVPQLPGNQSQNLISHRKTEHLVDKLEVLHVGAQQVIGLVRILPQRLTHPLIEKRLTVQSGQPVVLHLIHQRRRLPQGDDVCGPMQHHAGLVWLCNKVHGPAGQRIHLVLLPTALGHDNHGDGGQHLVCLNAFQKRIAVHHGHPDVQKDQRNSQRLPV